MKRISRWLGPVVLALIAGCQSWRVADVTPASLIARKAPDAVRVERLAGGRLELARPEIRGDTLYGRSGGTLTAVALRDIASISVKQGSPGKSLLLALGLLGGALAVVFVAVGASLQGASM